MRRSIRCRLGRHDWHMARAESVRYGVIYTYWCKRCHEEREVGRW